MKDYRIETSSIEEDKKSNQIDDGPTDIKECNDAPKDENDVCRICFNDSTSQTNPLFAPCKCTGTMKFIHLICLKSWLNQKLSATDNPQLKSYYWKTFECEICKTIYPCKIDIILVCIEHLGAKYPLADVEVPSTGNFILLESLIQEKNTSRIVNVVVPNETNNVFKLGRGHESDIRINDISVSRFHAQLKFSEEGFYIEDNNSKFGTLAWIPNIEINPGLGRAVQVGRTIISLNVKKAELLQ